MTKKEKIEAIIYKALRIGKKSNDASEDITDIKFIDKDIILPPIYMALTEWSETYRQVIKKQYRILGISITNRSDEGIKCWADYYDSVSECEEGYDIESLSDIEIDNIYNIINVLDETDIDKQKDLIDYCKKIIDSNNQLSEEYNEMENGLDFILEQWRTNKQYFSAGPGHVTTEDVIKKVFEYAWNKGGGCRFD